MTPFSRVISWLTSLVALFVVFTATPLRAQAVWEDYQGDTNVLGNLMQDKPGVTYSNSTGNYLTDLANLRAIAATPAYATRTGTASTIDFGEAGNTLCNLWADSWGSSDACQNDATGRVLYVMVKFPAAGQYSFTAAHDDGIDIDLSSDYANTSYRTANYDIAVGQPALGWTDGDNFFDPVPGSFNAGGTNRCALMRIYWNNNGGPTRLRLAWTKPDGTTEIVPSTQLAHPGQATSSTGCTGTITNTANQAWLTVNKLVGTSGRIAAADQFTISVTTGVTKLSSASTSGSGTGQAASTGAFTISTLTTYVLGDVMAAGSGSAITLYNRTISCTRNGLAFTPGGSAGAWTIAASSSADAVVCNITNARKTALLQLRKTWVNAVTGDVVTLPATTGFSANSANFTATANTANETDSGVAVAVGIGETGTLWGETSTSGVTTRYRSVLSCSTGTLSGTSGFTANTLTVPTSAADGTITCTYTNTYNPPLAVAIQSTPYSDPINGTTNPLEVPDGLVNYRIALTSPASFIMDGGTITLVDPLPSKLALYVSDLGTSGSGPASFTGTGSGLSYSFVSLSSTSDSIDFSNDGGATWTYVPTPDANGMDPAVNAIRIRLSGTMASSTSAELGLRAKIL